MANRRRQYLLSEAFPELLSRETSLWPLVYIYSSLVLPLVRTHPYIQDRSVTDWELEQIETTSCSSWHFQHFLQIAQFLAYSKYSTNAYCSRRKLKIPKYNTMLKVISVILNVHIMSYEGSKEDMINYIRLGWGSTREHFSINRKEGWALGAIQRKRTWSKAKSRSRNGYYYVSKWKGPRLSWPVLRSHLLMDSSNKYIFSTKGNGRL